MKFILTLVLITFHSVVFAFDEKCEGPSETGYVISCLLGKEIDQLDKQLNTKYQKIIQSYRKSGDNEYIKLLVAAQRAWISYRDKVCEFEDQAIGGSNSISWGRCKVRITKTRLNELNEFGDE